jgi:hypothetical protein
LKIPDQQESDQEARNDKEHVYTDITAPGKRKAGMVKYYGKNSYCA